jgi:predicted MFS family arabinose efflux permease
VLLRRREMLCEFQAVCVKCVMRACAHSRAEHIHTRTLSDVVLSLTWSASASVSKSMTPLSHRQRATSECSMRRSVSQCSVQAIRKTV